ncbi:hypothetical protein GO491_07510 [Flavobacteriaceae bacterium Ap0902]|nr:hypothetical protein [Flavobacteriaceae bacterium Ap0902]
MKRFFKVILSMFAFILLLLIGAIIAIQTPYVQTQITQRVLKSLNKQFGTALEVGSVDIDFFGDVKLYEVTAKDHHDLEFIRIPELIADLNLWDIYKNSSNISLDGIDLKHAAVQVITYSGEDTSNFIQFIDKFVVDDSSGSASEFKLKGNLIIEDSKFSIINQNLEENLQVWLDSENFNTTIRNIDLQGSTYQADIRELNFNANKNGENYTLKNLIGYFKMTDQGISLEDLSIETQSSILSGKIQLKYDSIAEFDDFGNKVNWDVLLEEGNQFGYKDLRYFVPTWEKDIVLNLEGTAQGSLNNLILNNFKINNGDTQLATESIDLGELYDGNFIVNTDYIEAKTSYTELKRILPESITKDITNFIARFGVVNYKGALQIDDSDLYAQGNALTALGDADLTLTLNNYSTNQAKYMGIVKTNAFDLKALTDTQELGRVSGNLSFDGGGYDVKTIKIKTKGKLNYIDVNGDRYQYLTVDGILDHEVFDGVLTVNDPNARLTYEGILDFSEPHLKLKFDSQVDYVNFNHFGITERRNTWLKTNINADTQFSGLNDLEGHIELTDVVFNIDTINLSLPSVTLDITATENAQKNLILDIPSYLSAKINGNYQLDEIVDVLQNGVGNFLVDYDRKPVSPNQVMSFEIQLEDNLISYFIPDLYLQPTTTVSGTANDHEHLFEFDLHSPFVQYAEYKADSLNIYASTTNNQTFQIDAEQLNIQNFLINQFNVDGQKLNDSIVANAQFYAGEENFSRFDLNFYQTFNNELRKVKTGFAPSKIYVEDQVWDINPNNERDSNYAILNFEDEEFIVNNILFQSDNQFLRLNLNYLNRNDFEVDADIENLNLAKIIPPSLIPNFKINGIANGEIDIVKNQDELKPVADFRIDSIMLDQYYIGNFTADATYDIEESIFDIVGSLDRDNVNTLFLTGAIDNKGEQPELDMVASLDDFRIGILGVFLEDVLSEWSGELSGDVTLKGNPSDPDLQGFVTGNDIGFKVNYLGTKYAMYGENDFILSKSPGTSGFLNIPNIEFTEVSSRTKGLVDGNLIFSDLSNWFLDLEFNTDRMLVMNNTVADNELFYGKVYGKGTFEMFGPASELDIYANDVDVLKGSSISLNTGGTSSVEEKQFIRFYAYDTQGQIIEPAEESNRLSGVTIDLSLNVDEGTEVKLVLDAQTDDEISARGIANNFSIQMNEAGNLNIDGEYILSGGTYNYREYLVIDKDFEIEEGGFLRFSGDPYNAELNVRAIYSRYVNNVGEYLGISNNQATIVDLIIDITGSLENTDINFDIEAPSAGSQISSALNTRLSSTTDELMKQASFLLVLGRFGTDELVSANTATGAATASAFELLGKQVGNIFSSIVPGLEINPTYLQSTNRNQESDRIQTQLNWAVNERLRINGAVGAPIGSQYNEVITTQVELDYDISKEADGGLIIRGFSRPTTLGIENYNYNSTYAQSYGAGVIYTKSFNSFKELFNFKKKSDTISASIKDSTSNLLKDITQKEQLSFIQFKK